MDQNGRARNAGTLWVLLALALGYAGLALFHLRPTGIPLLEGGVGVVLGLYICSRPAANAVGMLFERHAFRQLTTAWSGLGWLALNFAVLLAGWLVIVLGTTRLVARAT
jgi:hypothetical protein